MTETNPGAAGCVGLLAKGAVGVTLLLMVALVGAGSLELLRVLFWSAPAETERLLAAGIALAVAGLILHAVHAVATSIGRSKPGDLEGSLEKIQALRREIDRIRNRSAN